jgi:hypothetical protein
MSGALCASSRGVGIALMFASDESWMTEATPAKQRGSVLGIYHVAAKLAPDRRPLSGGRLHGAGYGALYLVRHIPVARALIPVTITRRHQPDPPDLDPYPLSRMYKLTPAALIGVFIAGFSNTGFLALLPIYAKEAEGAAIATIAAQLMAAAFFRRRPQPVSGRSDF